MENSLWAPMWKGVHLSEFVFQKSWVIASDFCGIQTHEDELCSTQPPMIDSISSTMFFSCNNKNIGNRSQIIGNHGQRHWKSQLSVEEMIKNFNMSLCSTWQGINSSYQIIFGMCHQSSIACDDAYLPWPWHKFAFILSINGLMQNCDIFNTGDTPVLY